jgi:hypothetical protein
MSGTEHIVPYCSFWNFFDRAAHGDRVAWRPPEIRAEGEEMKMKRQQELEEMAAKLLPLASFRPVRNVTTHFVRSGDFARR